MNRYSDEEVSTKLTGDVQKSQRCRRPPPCGCHPGKTPIYPPPLGFCHVQDAIGDGDCALCCIVGAMQDRSNRELVWAPDYDNSMILQEVCPRAVTWWARTGAEYRGALTRPYHGSGCLWSRIPEASVTTMCTYEWAHLVCDSDLDGLGQVIGCQHSEPYWAPMGERYNLAPQCR